MNGARGTTGVTMLGLITVTALFLGTAAAGNTTGPEGASARTSAPVVASSPALAGIVDPDQDFPWN
ncbi:MULTISPECIES: hypothetical protein [unclassified Streptomyces]|uniref:hypothetical protein n=1 Tax=unclassified Streptomyces TaxID=2593676 RepID=UPI002E0E54DD|nr:hypothetical protein OG457_13285 [Streptomyces sp. NBC_01207]WTA18039.1 hypothetical protein OG365_08185 [Streptomyces sp. NBC_00853]